jgi:hypothetical protein
MSYQLKGRLHYVGETKQVSDKFSKREFVVATEGKYPQLVAFELAKDKTGQIDGYSIGDPLVVEFDIRGREWSKPGGEVKFFTTLSAWRVVGDETKSANPSQSARGGADDGDDIPF